MAGTLADTRRIRWAAAAGTVAPLWFWTTLVTLAVLHGTIDVSGHQLLRFGFLMYLGFFAYGSLTLLFVWGLRLRLPRRRRSIAALVALTLVACGPLLATFTTGPEQGPPGSWHAALHFSGFLILSLVPMIALPLFAAAVWGDRPWRPLAPLSLVWTAAVVVVVFLPSAPAEGYPLWSGPGSMADIALIGTWQIVVSRRLARLAADRRIGQETPATGRPQNALA
jgi:hypothetical protein